MRSTSGFVSRTGVPHCRKEIKRPPEVFYDCVVCPPGISERTLKTGRGTGSFQWRVRLPSKGSRNRCKAWKFNHIKIISKSYRNHIEIIRSIITKSYRKHIKKWICAFFMILIWFWYDFDMVSIWFCYDFDMTNLMIFLWFWGVSIFLIWFRYDFFMILECLRISDMILLWC